MIPWIVTGVGMAVFIVGVRLGPLGQADIEGILNISNVRFLGSAILAGLGLSAAIIGVAAAILL